MHRVFLDQKEQFVYLSEFTFYTFSCIHFRLNAWYWYMIWDFGRSLGKPDVALRAGHTGAGDGHTLRLSAGQAVTALAHRGIQTLRQARGEGQHPGVAGGGLHLRVGGLGAGETDVLADRALEQVGALRDDRDARAHCGASTVRRRRAQPAEGGTHRRAGRLS